MIKEKLARAKDMLLGTCKHPRDQRGFGEGYDFCVDCGIRLEGDSSKLPDCGKTPGKGHNLDFRRPLMCLRCQTELPPPTTVFRSYTRLNKHIRLRRGTPTDRNGKKLSENPTYNVGLRFVIPGNSNAVRRAWVTFTDKTSQKKFAGMLDRRLRLCQDDEGYNEVINEALDIIREANPAIEEQVIERGEESDDTA